MVLKLPGRKVILPARKPLQVPARAGVTAARTVAPATSSLGGGFGKAHAINAQQQARMNRPFEFSMKVGEGGAEGVKVVLTDKVRLPGGMPYFHYIHRWGFEEGERNIEVCLQEDPTGCNLCREKNKKGTFEMVLSCIDTRPTTPKSGPNAGRTIPRTVRPYIVKTSMIPKFERIYRDRKSFRGVVLQCFRDNNKSPGGGSDINVISVLSEAQLSKYGNLANPLDYTKLYPRHTNEQIAALYALDGGGGGVGHSAVGDADISGVTGDDLPF